MQGLYRRESGTYVLRLTVPVRLRQTIGKREIIITTGTSVLCMAKIVAGALATQWGQRFFETELLISQSTLNPMHHSELLKITQGHPLLLAGGHITLTQAAGASGIASMDLLRASSTGKLAIYIRPGRKPGFLVPLEALPFDNPEMGHAGGYILPDMNRMPVSAVEHVNPGLLLILAMDLPHITSIFLAGEASVAPLAFEDPGYPGSVFIPNVAITVKLAEIEVLAGEVEMIRRSFSNLIPNEHVVEAKALQNRETEALKLSAGKKSHERLSTALTAYVTDRLRHDVSSESEIARIRNGCNLLIELSGDNI